MQKQKLLIYILKKNKIQRMFFFFYCLLKNIFAWKSLRVLLNNLAQMLGRKFDLSYEKFKNKISLKNVNQDLNIKNKKLYSNFENLIKFYIVLWCHSWSRSLCLHLLMDIIIKDKIHLSQTHIIELIEVIAIIETKEAGNNSRVLIKQHTINMPHIIITQDIMPKHKLIQEVVNIELKEVSSSIMPVNTQSYSFKGFKSQAEASLALGIMHLDTFKLDACEEGVGQNIIHIIKVAQCFKQVIYFYYFILKIQLKFYCKYALLLNFILTMSVFAIHSIFTISFHKMYTHNSFRVLLLLTIHILIHIITRSHGRSYSLKFMLSMCKVTIITNFT